MTQVGLSYIQIKWCNVCAIRQWEFYYLIFSKFVGKKGSKADWLTDNNLVYFSDMFASYLVIILKNGSVNLKV